MTPGVTVVTRQAQAADTLSDQDYRDIYEELRRKCSLRQFVELLHSTVSFAWWGKYEAGEATLTRERRVELRAAVGLPALPPTIGEVMAGVDPDATVWQIGEGRPDRVVLVGTEAHEPVEMRLNGNLQIVGETPAKECLVTAVTGGKQARPTKTIHLRPETWDRLSTARKMAGMTWDEFADRIVELLGDDGR